MRERGTKHKFNIFKTVSSFTLAALALSGCVQQKKHLDIGGVWVPPTPKGGSTLTTNIITLAFEGESKDGAKIDEIDFTATWKGQDWFTVCTDKEPDERNIYTCDMELPDNVGGITVSVDARGKNAKGEEETNYAPNGTRDYFVNKTS